MSAWLQDKIVYYYNGITALEHQWTKCINVAGDYVEKVAL